MVNIKFKKGLVWKLIPKYIGPYKVLKDYKNFLFKLDLPSKLKQRGMHDIFYMSLLQIHQPNDDHFFPGQMDSQIGLPEGAEGKWAVNKILLHTGEGLDSLFEVLWKSGDVTWLPMEYASHSQPMETYLEALGILDRTQIPFGKGKPLCGDPQISVLGIQSENVDKGSEFHSYITPCEFVSPMYPFLDNYPFLPPW